MVGRVGNQPGSLGWCGLDPEVAEGNTSSHRWGERQDHLPTGHEGAGTRMISMVKKNHRKVEASQMEPKRSKKIQKDPKRIFGSSMIFQRSSIPQPTFFVPNWCSQDVLGPLGQWTLGGQGTTNEHFVRIVAGGCLIFTRTSIYVYYIVNDVNVELYTSQYCLHSSIRGNPNLHHEDPRNY